MNIIIESVLRTRLYQYQKIIQIETYNYLYNLIVNGTLPTKKIRTHMHRGINSSNTLSIHFFMATPLYINAHEAI